LIESLREFEPAFRKICRKYNADYVLAAASDNQGVMEINVHDDLTGSSLFKEADGKFVNGVPRKVPG